MAPLIPIIASAIPSIVNLFTGDTSRTDSVVNLAKQAGELLELGTDSTQDQIIEHLNNNPEAVVKLKELEVQAKDLELQHLRKQNEELNRHEEVRQQIAHETYRAKSTMQDTIATKIINNNLPFIVLLVLINIAVVYFLRDKEYSVLVAAVSNIIGITIGNLFTERQSVVNFFFGSSIGSKDKQDRLNSFMPHKGE